MSERRKDERVVSGNLLKAGVHLLNLSGGGALLSTPEPREVGETVEFFLRTHPHKLEQCRATVRWCRSNRWDRFFVGVAFDGPPPDGFFPYLRVLKALGEFSVQGAT